MAEIVRFVLLPVLFLFGLSWYLAFVPFIATLRGLALVMQVLAGYGRTLVGVVYRRTPEFRTLPPYRPQDEEVKAYRNYFFGPASRDLRQLLTLEGRSYTTTVGDSFRAVTSRQFVAPTRHRAFTIPYGLTLYLGLCAGAALAVPLLGLLFALHALVLALLTGGARLLMRHPEGRRPGSAVDEAAAHRNALPALLRASALPVVRLPQPHLPHVGTPTSARGRTGSSGAAASADSACRRC